MKKQFATRYGTVTVAKNSVVTTISQTYDDIVIQNEDIDKLIDALTALKENS